eukprot:scaffold658198_cov50-Prasinocladus_malaysianus.AAC.1
MHGLRRRLPPSTLRWPRRPRQQPPGETQQSSLTKLFACVSIAGSEDLKALNAVSLLFNVTRLLSKPCLIIMLLSSILNFCAADSTTGKPNFSTSNCHKIAVCLRVSTTCLL